MIYGHTVLDLYSPVINVTFTSSLQKQEVLLRKRSIQAIFFFLTVKNAAMVYANDDNASQIQRDFLNVMNW